MWFLQSGDKTLQFTNDLTGVGLVSYPQISVDYSASVHGNPRGDGRRVGRDFVHGQNVVLQVEVHADHRSVEDVWRDLVSVWRADGIRRRGGMMAVLETDNGLRAYGRPRPIKQDQSRRLFDMVRAELVFECVDDLWYAPEVSTEVLFAPPVGGGLTFPAVAPFTFDSGPNSRNAAVSVEGDVATWPVFEISGPVTNPEIQVVGGARLALSVSLAYDETLLVDTRPWARHSHINGNPAGGAVSPTGDRLANMSLMPGEHQIVLKGYDPTGTASLKVRVASAFTSF